MPDWENLMAFLPPGLNDSMLVRSAVASTFAASLELVREGRLRIRQMGTFGPIYLRAAEERGGGKPESS
jgi:segregation and condensation protein A